MPPAPTKTPCVYILASKRNGTLYIGVTSNLRDRVWRHKKDIGSSFTREYRVHRLVWYETHPTMAGAIEREKNLKHWHRGLETPPHRTNQPHLARPLPRPCLIPAKSLPLPAPDSIRGTPIQGGD